MIDPNVFAELQNRGIITHTGLEASDFKNIDELASYGIATNAASEEVYADILEDIASSEEAVTALAALLEAIAAGGNVTLDRDYIVDAPIVINKDVVLDLNGHSIRTTSWIESDNTDNSYVFWVKSGKLTLNGDGYICAGASTYSMAVWANGGDVEINGGVYENAGNGSDLIYLSGTSNVTITNGEFNAVEKQPWEPGTAEKRSAINIKDKNNSTCNVYVKGGRFLEFDPANNKSENPVRNFVADGFESVADGNYFVVRPVTE